MPALANPSPWISVAKEIPALVARQLRDNDVPPPAHSPGNPWYRSWKFWIPAGIIIVVLLCVGGGLAAAGSGGPRLVAEPSEQEKEEYERRKRQWENEPKIVNIDSRPPLLAAVQDDQMQEWRRKTGTLTLHEQAMDQAKTARKQAMRAHGWHLAAPVNSPTDDFASSSVRKSCPKHNQPV